MEDSKTMVKPLDLDADNLLTLEATLTNITLSDDAAVTIRRPAAENTVILVNNPPEDDARPAETAAE